MNMHPMKIEPSYEDRLVRHYAARRRRLMSPANAVGEKKARAVVKPTVRISAESFLASRCEQLGTTVDAVKDRRGPQSMVPIRVALLLEVHQQYPALTKEALARIFNRQPKRIVELLEMWGPQG